VLFLNILTKFDYINNAFIIFIIIEFIDIYCLLLFLKVLIVSRGECKVCSAKARLYYKKD